MKRPRAFLMKYRRNLQVIDSVPIADYFESSRGVCGRLKAIMNAIRTVVENGHPEA